VISVPRTYVNYVVTEYGVVNLLGKSQRERAELLISIAHPDFRSELHRAARRLFWP
jgi:acyl-CoA hydrolase